MKLDVLKVILASWLVGIAINFEKFGSMNPNYVMAESLGLSLIAIACGLLALFVFRKRENRLTWGVGSALGIYALLLLPRIL